MSKAPPTAAEFAAMQGFSPAGRKGNVLSRQLLLSGAELSALLERVSQAANQGLSVRSAAALCGISNRTVECWVFLAEADREPWASWLQELSRSYAQARQQGLVDLKSLADVDVSCRRELYRQLGQPTPLDKELAELRRSRTAERDALAVKDDAALSVQASSRETDVQSVASAKEAGICAPAGRRASQGGES